MNKIALWINVCADDWTAERAIIASNNTGWKYRKWDNLVSVFEKWGNFATLYKDDSKWDFVLHYVATFCSQNLTALK